MKKLIFLFLFTYLNSVTFISLDYREGKQINICYQTAELFENTWYLLTNEQKKKSVKLKLTKHTPDYIIIGGTTTEYTNTSKGFDFYKGRTKKGKSVAIGVDIYNRSILNLTLGDLHTKEFNCIKETK